MKITGVRAVPASILLYGPPGCGKTKLAKAVAGEAQAAFLSIGPSDVLSKFVGESEASIKQLFERAKGMAGRMESRCCVLFFDEIDALGMSRGGSGGGKEGGGGDGSSSEHSSRRVLAELLIQLTSLAEDMEMDPEEEEEVAHTHNTGDNGDHSDDHNMNDCNGMDPTKECSNIFKEPRPISPTVEECMDSDNSNAKRNANMNDSQILSQCPTPVSSSKNKSRIIVIAATNRPEDCDTALLRRFSIRVLVGLPSQRDRKKILSRLLEGIQNNITREELLELSSIMEGFSGSDLESVTREAVMAPIRECLRSAAIMKMKSRKKVEQHNVDNDGPARARRPSLESVDSNELARDELLDRFQNLRSVTTKDFEEAISFWIGDGQEEMTAQMTNEASICHYDSDDSNADEKIE